MNRIVIFADQAINELEILKQIIGKDVDIKIKEITKVKELGDIEYLFILFDHQSIKNIDYLYRVRRLKLYYKKRSKIIFVTTTALNHDILNKQFTCNLQNKQDIFFLKLIMNEMKENSFDTYETLRMQGVDIGGIRYLRKDHEGNLYAAHSYLSNRAKSFAFLQEPLLKMFQDGIFTSMPKIKELYYDRNLITIIYDYQNNLKLDDYLYENECSLKMRLAYFLMVLYGVRQLHQLGYIHGGLLYSQLFIDRNKIIIANLESICKVNSYIPIYENKKYVAYEKREGLLLDERCDIYDLGLILDQLTIQMFDELSNDYFNYEKYDELDKVEKLILEIIMKCCMVDKEERYQSVDELIKVMKDLMDLI